MNRLLTYIANEFIVEKLSNSRVFQNFVVKSNTRIKKGIDSTKAKMQDLGTDPRIHNLNSSLNSTQSTVATFASAFFDNIKKQVSQEMKKQIGKK